jgi:hypothetical protein
MGALRLPARIAGSEWSDDPFVHRWRVEHLSAPWQTRGVFQYPTGGSSLSRVAPRPKYRRFTVSRRWRCDLPVSVSARCEPWGMQAGFPYGRSCR